MKYSPEQQVKITCPNCGHEQLIKLEMTMGARYVDEFIHSISGKEAAAAFGSFDCLCGKRVDSWLFSVERDKK